MVFLFNHRNLAVACQINMSIFLSEESSVKINLISAEDFYNCLYWDHRIYDLRSNEDYNQSHLCRSHNMRPLTRISIEEIFDIDVQIDNDYGKAEHRSDVLLYTNDKTHEDYQFENEILNMLISYLISSKNPSNKSLKQINILNNGYETFHILFPFLCSDSIHYDQCSQIIWPSYITSNFYIGSSICRNETVVSMLKISHIMSFSDYPINDHIELSNIKSCHFQISDSLSSNMLDLFPSAVEWISKSINDDKGNVLIHCDQGVSRSSTIVIAYLLYSNKNFSTVDKALNFVKSKRSIIRPNQSFLQ